MLKPVKSVRYGMGLMVALASAGSAWAQQQTMTQVAVTPEAGNTRVVFSLTGPVQYKVFSLEQPSRVVIDFRQVRESHAAVSIPSDAVVGKFRSAIQSGEDVRVVLELRSPASPSAFLATPEGGNGHRLVLDLKSAGGATPTLASASSSAAKPFVPPAYRPVSAAPAVIPASAPVVAATVMEAPAVTAVPAVPVSSPVAQVPVQAAAVTAVTSPAPVEPASVAETVTPVAEPARPGHLRDVVVAIDAGHGGQDPGAHGPKGTNEKHVTLAIARALAAELNKQSGVKAKLVRTGDYFIPLKSRRDIARTKLNADLFVSIHADAAVNRDARGASVFALSRSGATSSLAQMLAVRENESDLVGGALQEKDNMVASVIADLALEGAMDHSMKVGGRVLREVGAISPLHHRYIEKAGFAVLKNADFPSILVETGFISNPAEEARLASATYQQQLAHAISRGVMGYFGDNPPPSTLLAWQRDKRSGAHANVNKPARSVAKQPAGKPSALRAGSSAAKTATLADESDARAVRSSAPDT